MSELAKEILNAPLGTILILAGLAFLAIGIVGKIKGKIEPGTWGRVLSGIAGLIFLGIGLAMHLGGEGKKGGGDEPEEPPTTDLSIARFSADPLRIQSGEQSTLSWETRKASEVTIEGIGSVAESGSTGVSPRRTTTYELTASDGAGGSKTAQLTVQVSADAPVDPADPVPSTRVSIQRFSASPQSIRPGRKSTLSWEVKNANRVSIDGRDVPVSGSLSVSPGRTTTFQLVARGARGDSRDATLTIEVTEGSAPTISAFVVKPDQIRKGERTLLGWRTSGATSVELRPGGRVALSGSQEIQPIRSTRYTLIARNAQGRTAEKTVTVKVKQTSSSRIHSRGQMVVQGNWLCDLDSGKGRRSREGSDFFWQDRTSQRLLIPYNNARFWVLGKKNFDSLSHEDLRRISYSGDRIDGSNSRRNRIPTGTVVAAITSDRRYCKFRIDKYGSDLKITWVTYAK